MDQWGRRSWSTLDTVDFLTPVLEAIVQIEALLEAREIMFSLSAEEIGCILELQTLSAFPGVI